MFYKNYRKNGFTLIELLVVIAIITVLVAVLMPALKKAWNRGAYGSWTQQKNAIKGDVNCAAYFTFEEGPGIPAGSNTNTANLAYAYNPDPGGGFIPDPPENATLNNSAGNWNRDNSRFRGLKYGLMFDGTNDYVDCTNNQRFDITGTALTIEAWVNPGSPLAAGGVISKSALVGNRNYSLSVTAAGQIVFYVSPPAGTLTTSAATPPVTAGRWNHIVGTYDGSFLRAYCNGVFVNQVAEVNTLVTSDGALEIGRVGGSYFDGVIDEIAVYNIALSSEEISRHYQSGNR